MALVGVGVLAVAYRRPGVAAPVLAATLLLTYPGSAAAFAATSDQSFLAALARLAVVVTAQLVVVAALGWAVRAARARTVQQRELTERTRLAAAIGRERARIAGELNSVVVARLQRVVALTQQLREQLEESPHSAHQVLSEVHAEARQALAAMRRTLGFLRSDRSGPVPRPMDRTPRRWTLPAPTLSGIGLAVAFGERGDEIELFAQRILMEALTNVLRHAGPAATRVLLAQHADAVTLEVADAGPVPGRRPGADGGGHGLLGSGNAPSCSAVSCQPARTVSAAGWCARGCPARRPSSPSR